MGAHWSGRRILDAAMIVAIGLAWGHVIIPGVWLIGDMEGWW